MSVPFVVIDPVPTNAIGLAVVLSEEERFHHQKVEQPRRWSFASGCRRLVALVLRSEAEWELLGELGAARQNEPDLLVLALLPDDSAVAYRNAFERHAVGACPWSSSPEELLAVARAAAEGRGLVACDVLNALSTSVARYSGQPPAALEQWEVRALQLLRQGWSIKDIAKDAGWSYRQFQRKMVNLYERLGARHRHQAVELALDYGIIGRERPGPQSQK